MKRIKVAAAMTFLLVSGLVASQEIIKPDVISNIPDQAKFIPVPKDAAIVSGAVVGHEMARYAAIQNVLSARSLNGAVKAANNAPTDMMKGAAAGVAVAGITVAIANEMKFRDHMHQVAVMQYGLTTEDYEREDAQDMLRILLEDTSRPAFVPLPASWYRHAIAKFKEKPEPRMAQLFVDASYKAMLSCRMTWMTTPYPDAFASWKNDTWRFCNEQMVPLFASLGLPTDIERKQTNAIAHLPPATSNGN